MAGGRRSIAVGSRFDDIHAGVPGTEGLIRIPQPPVICIDPMSIGERTPSRVRIRPPNRAVSGHDYPLTIIIEFTKVYIGMQVYSGTHNDISAAYRKTDENHHDYTKKNNS